MKLVFQIISRIFDPIIEIPIMFAVAVWYAYVNGHSWLFLGMLLFMNAVLPFIFFLYLLRRGAVADWDLSKRMDRIPIYGFALATQIAGIGLAVLTERMAVAQILLIFWLLGIIFFAITLFWKVSVHAGVNAALVTLIVLVGGTNYLPLFLVLLPVGWARVAGGYHTAAQFVIGALIAGLSLWGGFYLIGLR